MNYCLTAIRKSHFGYSCRQLFHCTEFAQSGFFELQADSNSKLIDALKSHPEVEKVSESEGKVIVHFKSQFDASLLNRYLAEKGIYLNHLVNKKMSLEEQFLALTNK